MLDDDSLDSSSAQTSANPSTKRKRGGGTGSSARGVANLTPEQLARKRANDREAQRAIRERTKHQIDQLNQEIRDLKSQQPYNDLQAVIRQKDAVQAENDDIKRRLASVMALIQPLLGNQNLHDLAAAAEREPYPESQYPHAAQPAHARQKLPYMSSQYANNHGSASNAVSPQTFVPPEQHGVDRPGGTSHNGMAGQDQDERLGVDFLLDSNSQTKLENPALVTGATEIVAAQVTVPVGDGNKLPAPFAMLPYNRPASCLLDNVMLEFLRVARTSIAQGVPVSALVGPPYPNFTALVYPDRHIETHKMSQVFIDIMRTFPNITPLTDRVAVVYLMFLIMRWQLDPTEANYDRLPFWLRPTPRALFIPHSTWIDYLPWPALKDRLIGQQPEQIFENFFIPFSSQLSVNWPHDPRECLISTASSAYASPGTASAASPFSPTGQAGSPQTPGAAYTPGSNLNSIGDTWNINPAFEYHIRDLANWSVGPSFAAALPHLADCVRIRPT